MWVEKVINLIKIYNFLSIRRLEKYENIALTFQATLEKRHILILFNHIVYCPWYYIEKPRLSYIYKNSENCQKEFTEFYYMKEKVVEASRDFEKSVFELLNRMDTEGTVGFSSHISQYNALLCHFISMITMYKGLAAPFKSEKPCKDLIKITSNLEKMVVDPCTDCPDQETDVKVIFCSSTVIFKSVVEGSGKAIDQNTFQKYLCDELPDQIYKLISFMSYYS